MAERKIVVLWRPLWIPSKECFDYLSAFCLVFWWVQSALTLRSYIRVLMQTKILPKVGHVICADISCGNDGITQNSPTQRSSASKNARKHFQPDRQKPPIHKLLCGDVNQIRLRRPLKGFYTEKQTLQIWLFWRWKCCKQPGPWLDYPNYAYTSNSIWSNTQINTPQGPVTFPVEHAETFIRRLQPAILFPFGSDLGRPILSVWNGSVPRVRRNSSQRNWERFSILHQREREEKLLLTVADPRDPK